MPNSWFLKTTGPSNHCQFWKCAFASQKGFQSIMFAANYFTSSDLCHCIWNLFRILSMILSSILSDTSSDFLFDIVTIKTLCDTHPWHSTQDFMIFYPCTHILTYSDILAIYLSGESLCESAIVCQLRSKGNDHITWQMGMIVLHCIFISICLDITNTIKYYSTLYH